MMLAAGLLGSAGRRPRPLAVLVHPTAGQLDEHACDETCPARGDDGTGVHSSSLFTPAREPRPPSTSRLPSWASHPMRGSQRIPGSFGWWCRWVLGAWEGESAIGTRLHGDDVEAYVDFAGLALERLDSGLLSTLLRLFPAIRA